MRYDIKTAAGARTRLVFRLFPEPEKAEVELHVRTDAGVQSFSPSVAEPASVLLPPLCAGRYLYDFCLSGQVLIHGELQVRPSALWGGCAEVLSVVTVDLPLVAFVLNPGPRGEIGAQGPQGLSAYELAARHGYDGSEADWVAELQGAQAAAAEAKQQAQQSAQAATSASDYASAAGIASTAAADAAKLAGVQANTATGAASTAKEYRDLSQADAEAAAAFADTAQKSDSAAQQAASAAAQSAEDASGFASTADNQASAAAQSAEAAFGSAEAAASSAAAADKSAADAAATLASAAQVGANNEFAETNTFNGALVANGSLLYGQQELGDLLTYPVITRLMEAGINPVSALAQSWEEWVALNPNWESLGTLLFYAPLMQGESIPAFSSISTPFSQCTFISPANVGGKNCQYLLSKNITLYSLKAGICTDVYNCYNVKKCSLYVPKVTTFQNALSAVGYSNGGVELELSVYAPELHNIVLNSVDTTFWRMGLLKSFSIYAPKLVSSFNFSRQTLSGKGQTCAILQALIAGIGTPGTMQTITTITPSDGDEVQTVDGVEKTKKDMLRKAAATKKWKFIIPAKDAEGNDITIDL